MMNMTEKAPLPFLHLSEAGFIVGVALFISGLWMLLMSSEALTMIAVIQVSVGIALAFVAGYYRGCGNGACTPRDW